MWLLVFFSLIILCTTLKFDSTRVDEFTGDNDVAYSMFASLSTQNEQSYTISMLCDDCVFDMYHNDLSLLIKSYFSIIP